MKECAWAFGGRFHDCFCSFRCEGEGRGWWKMRGKRRGNDFNSCFFECLS